MADEILDKVVEDLSKVIPLINRSINRKLIKPIQTAFNADITPLHFMIMKMLDEEGKLHITEIGEKLQINRPQMTYLIDQLVCLELVEREHGTEDRRIINISLTVKGKSHLIEHDRLIKDVFRTALSGLTGKEIEELLASLTKLRDIFFRLE
jgi:DNA-binding MarR family transcriptional regulator